MSNQFLCMDTEKGIFCSFHISDIMFPALSDSCEEAARASPRGSLGVPQVQPGTTSWLPIPRGGNAPSPTATCPSTISTRQRWLAGYRKEQGKGQPSKPPLHTAKRGSQRRHMAHQAALSVTGLRELQRPRQGFPKCYGLRQ